MRLPRPRRMRNLLTSNVLIFLGMLIVSYQLFTYAKKVYQDYQVDLQIAQYQQDIEDLKVENKDMKSLIDYLQTDAYREKVAKSTSGLKNPGEEVYIVKGTNPDTPEEELAAARKKLPYQLTNAQKWWEYFFGTRLYVTE